MIKFVVDGTPYEFDEGRLMSVEAMAIKKYTGLSIVEFLNGIIGGDGGALTGLVFLAKKRAGEPVSWADLDTLEMFSLVQSISLENTPPAPAEPEPGTEVDDTAAA